SHLCAPTYFPTRRSSDLNRQQARVAERNQLRVNRNDRQQARVMERNQLRANRMAERQQLQANRFNDRQMRVDNRMAARDQLRLRSEEHTSELQSPDHLVC